ncbi:MAG: exo-alpha-sialidase, partial [Verrucomicrobia bacterium]|nr:exo-alpha-sialidase [Verrucomicrobiota bacterium]
DNMYVAAVTPVLVMMIERALSSSDNGRSWGATETLFDRLGASGVFVRHPPTVLDNGDILLPIFYGNARPGEKWVGSYDTSAVRISGDRGETWQEYQVPDSTRCVHMSVSQLQDGSLLALFRSRWADNRNLEVGDGYCMTNNSREQLNREYSYPSIKQGPDAALHIAFTYFRPVL